MFSFFFLHGFFEWYFQHQRSSASFALEICQRAYAGESSAQSYREASFNDCMCCITSGKVEVHALVHFCPLESVLSLPWQRQPQALLLLSCNVSHKSTCCSLASFNKTMFQTKNTRAASCQQTAPMPVKQALQVSFQVLQLSYSTALIDQKAGKPSSSINSFLATCTITDM